MSCPICGLLIGNPQVHIAWHLNAGDVEGGSRCPLDGGEMAVSSSGPNGGYTHFTCGHMIRWDKKGRVA